MMLHTFNPAPMSLPSINFLYLTVSEIWPGKDFIVQGHFGKFKVKSRSHHDTAHLYPLSNVPTKCQIPTPYRSRDIVRTRFYKSRSLQQGQRSNQGHSMTLHTNTPSQCLYQLSTSYTLKFLRYSPEKIL